MRELSSLSGETTKRSTGSARQKPAAGSRGKADLRPILAFFVTLILYIFLMIVNTKYPLGKNSSLISDLRAQYAPFLALMRSKLTGIGSIPQSNLLSYLSYSFELGLGKNFIGTFGYYLASPFNLLYLLLDKTQIDCAVLLIVVLKLCFSSAFMCLFTGLRSGDKKTHWPVLLGTMYAFSLYALSFMLHIMWLDGYMILPLILFFTEKFIKEQKYAGLVLSLLYLFISNYYIAYMVGIACFLYLCIRMIAEKTELKKAFGIGFRYVVTAGFTALITAVMLIPVGLDTIRSADQTISNNGRNLIAYTPLTLIHMFVMGENEDFDSLMSGNYPYLFICLPVVILTLIYFLSPVFKGRERKVHAFCMLGVLLSTALYPIDKIWHVFDDPNWFWHRQAFVFLPLFLIITMKVLLRIKEVARRDITKAMLIMYLLVILDFSIGRASGKSDAALFNLSLITAYCGLFAGYGLEKWPEQLKDMPRMLSPLLSGIIFFELAFAGPMMTSRLETITINSGSAEDFILSLNAENEFGRYADSRTANTGAFRAETEKITDYTDKNYVDEGEAFYANYRGIAFFNSNSNKQMHHFMKQLGMQTNYNYFAVWHTFACPSVDSFFSVGSVSARKDISFYRKESEDSFGSGLGFYANDDFLPLAFAADEGAHDFDFYRLEKDAENKDYFALQNDWYRSMFPEVFTEDFFIEYGEEVTGAPVILNGTVFNSSEYVSNKELLKEADTSEENKNESADYTDPLGLESSVYGELEKNMTDIYRINENTPIVVEYEFKAPSDDELYCALATGTIVDGADLYVNGVKAYTIPSYTYFSQMFRLGKFNEGDDVKVTFLSEDDEWSYLNISFAGFDSETFSKQIAGIDKDKVRTEVVYDGYAKFDVNGMEADETVITTIPAEDGWQLYIDGSPAEHTVYQNAFISFDVPAGDHVAELVFTAPGLKAGACVSCAGAVLLAAFIFIDRRRSKKKETQK